VRREDSTQRTEADGRGVLVRTTVVRVVLQLHVNKQSIYVFVGGGVVDGARAAPKGLNTALDHQRAKVGEGEPAVVTRPGKFIVELQPATREEGEWPLQRESWVKTQQQADRAEKIRGE
jgi:hypothetical protein